MKMSARRLLSAFLALILILSVMPLAAFASETEDHPDGCFQGSVYAITPCNHIYYTYESTSYEYYDNDYHLATSSIIQSCSLCGFSITVSEDVAKREHTVETYTLIDAATHTYEGDCIYCDVTVEKVIYP